MELYHIVVLLCLYDHQDVVLCLFAIGFCFSEQLFVHIFSPWLFDFVLLDLQTLSLTLISPIFQCYFSCTISQVLFICYFKNNYI